MPPRKSRSQTAYHLYFRFCRNLILYPSLKDIGVTRVGQYKTYVREVLNASGDYDSPDNDSSEDEDGQVEKYFGYASFTDMSKRIGQMWTEAGVLTKSVFKELAKEYLKRHEKEVFESYKRFTQNLPVPVPVLHDTVKAQNQHASVSKEADDAIKSKDATRISTLKLHQIKEVDIPDKEILSMAIRSWDLDPTHIDIHLNAESASTTDLCDFLSKIEWD